MTKSADDLPPPVIFYSEVKEAIKSEVGGERIVELADVYKPEPPMEVVAPRGYVEEPDYRRGGAIRRYFDEQVARNKEKLVDALIKKAIVGERSALKLVFTLALPQEVEESSTKTVFEGIHLEVSPGSAVTLQKLKGTLPSSGYKNDG